MSLSRALRKLQGEESAVASTKMFFIFCIKYAVDHVAAIIFYCAIIEIIINDNLN